MEQGVPGELVESVTDIWVGSGSGCGHKRGRVCPIRAVIVMGEVVYENVGMGGGGEWSVGMGGGEEWSVGMGGGGEWSVGMGGGGELSVGMGSETVNSDKNNDGFVKHKLS